MADGKSPEDRIENSLEKLADVVSAFKVSIDSKETHLDALTGEIRDLLVTQGKILTQLKFQWVVLALIIAGNGAAFWLGSK